MGPQCSAQSSGSVSCGGDGAMTTPTAPGPTWAPIAAPSSLTKSSTRSGHLLAQLRGEPVGAVGRGEMVHRDRDRPVVGGLDGVLHQPVHRPGRGPHLLQRHDPPLAHVEHRLDRQSRAQQGGGGADPAAPAQVLEGVDDEERAGRRGGVPRDLGDGGASAPSAAARAAASTAKPMPMAVDRESTTVTRCSPTWEAASRAASVVLDSSDDRWMETSRSASAPRRRR